MSNKIERSAINMLVYQANYVIYDRDTIKKYDSKILKSNGIENLKSNFENIMIVDEDKINIYCNDEKLKIYLFNISKIKESRKEIGIDIFLHSDITKLTIARI